ncbi:MAG TPA: hypothetical protein VNV15_06325 [Opitutaceae bacterium]|nr:hypothetical protein [Opitutaceae bacterium]
MIEKLIAFLRYNYDLMVSELAAEQAIAKSRSMPTVTIKGRDASTGFPRSLVLNSPEILAAIDG